MENFNEFHIFNQYERCFSRSDSIFDERSSSSSLESPHKFHRPTPSVPRCHCAKKVERTQFEMKFDLRENIFRGCDVISELSERVPFLGSMKTVAEYIREQTVLGRPQNVCIRWGVTEDELITEYIKIFMKIADSWLNVRNCFGQDGRCLKKLCCMDEKNLSTNYADWMHSTKQLLQSLVQGLEKINNNCKMLTEPDLPPVGGLWGYPANPPCQCPPKTETTASFPLFPEPPPRKEPTVSSDYITPSSYDISLKNLPASRRNQNLTQAKSELNCDLPLTKAYSVKLTKTTAHELHKSASEASLEKQKDFADYKSDTDGHLLKKDKKTFKKIWPRRRRQNEDDD